MSVAALQISSLTTSRRDCPQVAFFKTPDNLAALVSAAVHLIEGQVSYKRVKESPGHRFASQEVAGIRRLWPRLRPNRNDPCLSKGRMAGRIRESFVIDYDAL